MGGRRSTGGPPRRGRSSRRTCRSRAASGPALGADRPGPSGDRAMRRVRYGVGMSLDGFIADVDYATGWMTGDPAYDSKPFLESVDTALVGRRSYEVMLRHGVRAYPGLPTYVFSRTLKAAE